MRTAVFSLLICLAAVLGGMQLVPLEFPRDNPPATAPLQGPPEVVAVVQRSCQDCHSNATRWPWYAWVAPASWIVTEDVAAARARLNFSAWEGLREGVKRRNARKVVEEVAAGEMPLRSYLWLHPETSIRPEDLKTLITWRDSLEEP